MRQPLHIESLTARPRRAPLASRIRREWCFVKIVAVRLRWQAATLTLLLLGGGLLFQTLGDRPIGLAEAVYTTWALVFGEAPDEFPRNLVLEAMLFITPALGLTVVLEGLIEFALLLRDRRRSERDWCRAMCGSMRNHVVLVGLGKLGFRIFSLLRRMGEEVVVIEADERGRFLEDVRRDGTPLLVGDARRDALLADANIKHAKAVILATSDDLANLEIALDARRMNPEVRVVLRMFDQNMADKIADGLNIKVALSQSTISAPAFAAAAIDPEIMSTTVVSGRLIVVKRWVVKAGGALAGKTVGEVMDASQVAVVERKPGGENGAGRLFPPTHERLEPGDVLLVQGPIEELTRLSVVPSIVSMKA